MRDCERRSMSLNIKDEHYPSLFLGAEKASGSAQKTYLLLQRLYLGSLVLGSIIGTFTALTSNPANTWLRSTTAIVLALGLLLFWVIRAKRYDKTWFDCRAVAESVKTATWRFIMHAPPFQNDGSIEEDFITELREIRQARPDSEKNIAGVIDFGAAPITDFMRQARSLYFEDRKNLYIEYRLRDQKSWYSHKANVNARAGGQWFWTIVGLQALAVTIAIIQATVGGLKGNVVPVFTTCTAAVAAWSQMKRYDELAQSYALAAQELGELDSIATNLTIESDFFQLVEQVEEAISREHTMWCARRDVLLRRPTGDKIL